MSAARMAEEHLAHANREIGADAAPGVAAIDAVAPIARAGQAAAMVAAPLVAGLGGLAAPLIVPAIQGLAVAGRTFATPFLANPVATNVWGEMLGGLGLTIGMTGGVREFVSTLEEDPGQAMRGGRCSTSPCAS